MRAWRFDSRSGMGTFRVDFRAAVDLPGEERTCLQNGTGLLAFRRTDHRSLLRSLALNAGLSTRQIQNHNLVSQIAVQGDRSAAAGLWIVGVAAGHHNLHFLARRRVVAAALQSQSRQRCRSYNEGRGTQQLSSRNFSHDDSHLAKSSRCRSEAF